MAGGSGADERRRWDGIVDDGAHLATPAALFPLHQLAHEVEVGRDDRPALLDDAERVHHRAPVARHQVRDDQCGRPRDARLAVNEHLAAATARRLCTAANAATTRQSESE